MIGNSSFHRGSNAQRFMNPPEIVIREVQSNGSFQVVELLRERIGEARKPSHAHSHGEVLAFYEASAHVFLVRFTLSDLGYNLDDWAWGVFGFAVVLAVISVEFYELGKVHIRAKRPLNGVHVEPESVRGDLDSVFDSLCQIINESRGSASCPLADCEGQNQLGFGINGHENPLIAKLTGIVSADAALLLETELA